MRLRTRFLAVCIGSSLLAFAFRLNAKNPTNAGPENPEIKFKIPTEPAFSPEEALKKFRLDDRFEIQVVATEPMVEEPIALSFDEKGRLFVVELRGYMHDIDGKGEDQPVCRIKRLEDTNGDGVMDRSTIFVDKLIMPRGVLAIAGGALVAEPPYLSHYVDTDGDGVADTKTVLAEDFGRRGGPPEHMANTPVFAMDNWVYCSNYAKRFKFEKGKWITAASRIRGQWGLSQDDIGRLYYNYNADLLRADLVPAQYLSRNANFTATVGFNYKTITDQSVWPDKPTPGVNRGYETTALRPDGSLKATTAACAPTVYRGDLFPAEYRGNAFICDPAINLIKRVTLATDKGLIAAANPNPGKEFLTSADERFRPVFLANGPDGALYIADLYRGIVQHQLYLTNYLLKNIAERKLDAPIHYGRIYRIVPKGAHPAPTRIPDASADIVALLAHPNGEVRDHAQRILVERRDPKVASAVRKLAKSGPTWQSRLHALWTLEGTGKMEQDIALEALKDPDENVRVAAIRMAEPFIVPNTVADVLPPLVALAETEQSFPVRIQLALTLSGIQSPEAEATLAKLMERGADESALMREATLSGLRGRELEFLQRLIASPKITEGRKYADLISALAQCVINDRRASRVSALLELLSNHKDAVGRAILEGMAGRPAAPGGFGAGGFGGAGGGGGGRRGGFVRPVRTVYLEAKPPILDTLLADPATKDFATRVDSRLAWPGKPGVPPPPVIRPLTASEQTLFDKGKVVYANVCGNCHQPNGQGQDGLAPPLVDSEWVLGPAERLPRIVFNGVAGPITVSGTQFLLEMPALPTLTDEEVAAALTYIRREWEHGGDPVDVELVKHVRAEVGERAMWTAEELLKIK